jgi:branched-chain amino acid transport system ATP-binding protein
MLFVDHINVFYDSIQALWDVSLVVEKGQVVALLGSNGAGKSTTINAITGIIKISSGVVKLGAQEIQNLPSHLIVENGLCQIPEERLIFSEMSVKENLDLGTYVQRARKDKNQKLEEIYEMFPRLSERKKQKAGLLSGGEQQMLAIARGLMSRPSVLILDEPSFGLAPVLVDEIFKIVKNINEQGVTILIVEQNIYQALEIADYGYVLENGRITLEGTGQELSENSYVKESYLGI